MRDQWSVPYIVVGPVRDRDDLVKIIRDCGCGGIIKVAKSQLIHTWHYLHGDGTIAAP